MDSPQSVVSPLKNSSVFSESEKQKANLHVQNPGFLSSEINFQEKDSTAAETEDFLGVFEVYVHQARDIHNICIYQKQDVYAKLSLTSDPENTVSTKIINGGGRNPIFNENLRLSVRRVDSSLKCEIWMLSRVRNYLEDQLLGFALVPVSEVLLHDGKLEKEFSLSSTDLFHSPAGFVQLSVTYAGASPDVIPIPAKPMSVAADSLLQETECIGSPPCDLDKIEFPDPNIVNEDCQMVEDYFAMPCTDMVPDTENQVSSQTGIQPEESLSNSCKSSRPSPTDDSPVSSITNGASSASLPVSSQSSETPIDSKYPNDEHVSPPIDNSKGKNAIDSDSESKAAAGLSSNTFEKPVLTINLEPEPKVVQQDIVDMYMKSMQQFSESLAKMKLPVDFESGPTSSGNSSSDQKSPTSKNSGSRVFYGSRAFF